MENQTQVGNFETVLMWKVE